MIHLFFQQALNDFANELNAKTINILGGGHFNSNAGYDKFPELLSQIKEQGKKSTVANCCKCISFRQFYKDLDRK